MIGKRHKLQHLPIGTKVSLQLDNGQWEATTTRSHPWQLGHGQWVVQVEGRAGGYDLDRIIPSSET